jgi:hypothetical protein
MVLICLHVFVSGMKCIILFEAYGDEFGVLGGFGYECTRTLALNVLEAKYVCTHTLTLKVLICM